MLEQVKSIGVESFDYQLPDERIAKYPLKERDASKLLVYSDEGIKDAKFANLADELPPNSLLVFNNTKVVQARIKFKKLTGGTIEVFCLNPVEPVDFQESFATTGKCLWLCIVGNLKRWKDEPLHLQASIHGEAFTLIAHKRESAPDGWLIDFEWDGTHSFAEVLEATGEVPIPPYLNRGTEAEDHERYQTVYSRIKGSVAAPTSGLHFTPKILDAIKQRGIQTSSVTLHIGAGTFRPVKADTIGEHSMHTEQFVVNKETIQALVVNNASCLAVGTTSVRTLESLYWLGIKAMDDSAVLTGGHLAQWDAYVLPQEQAAKFVFEHILQLMDQLGLEAVTGATQLVIVPGYKFRVVRGMVTNFHQPKSTLLLLVGAFIGSNWEKVYQHALNGGYRFLSYGDGSLLLP